MLFLGVFFRRFFFMATKKSKKVKKSRYPLFNELTEGSHYYRLRVELFTEMSKDSDNYMKSEYKAQLDHLKDTPIPSDIALLDTSYHICKINDENIGNGEVSIELYATSTNELTKYMVDLFQTHKNMLLEAKDIIASKDWSRLNYLIAIAFYDTNNRIDVLKQQYIESVLKNKEDFDKDKNDIELALEWIDSKVEEIEKVMDKTRRKIDRVRAAKADYEQYITIYNNWEV